MGNITYRVEIPVRLGPRTSFRVNLRNRSQWTNLFSAYVSDQNRVVLPDDQFRYDKVVEDEVLYKWIGQDLVEVEDPRPARPGAIVLVLESPHACEYDEYFNPIGPLRNPRSRAKVYSTLLNFLRAQQLPNDRDVVLTNPIPFQTSLYRLLKPCAQVCRPTGLRDPVWKALWSARDRGRCPFQKRFLDQLVTYQPCYIINACSGGQAPHGPKSILQRFLQDEGYHPALASEHVSAWGANTTITPGQLEDREV